MIKKLKCATNVNNTEMLDIVVTLEGQSPGNINIVSIGNLCEHKT